MRKIATLLIALLVAALATPAQAAFTQDDLTPEIWSQEPVSETNSNLSNRAGNLEGYGNLDQAEIGGVSYFVAAYQDANSALYKVQPGSNQPELVLSAGKPVVDLFALAGTGNYLAFAMLSGSALKYTTLNVQTGVLTTYPDFLISRANFASYNAGQISARNGRTAFLAYATNIGEPRLVVHDLASDQFSLLDHAGQEPSAVTLTDDHFFYLDTFGTKSVVVGSISPFTVLATRPEASLDKMYALENENILFIESFGDALFIDAEDASFAIQPLLDQNSNPVVSFGILDIDGNVFATGLNNQIGGYHLGVYEVQRTLSGISAMQRSDFDFSADSVSTLGPARFIPGTSEMLIFQDLDIKLYNYQPGFSGDVRRAVTVNGATARFDANPISVVPRAGGALVISEAVLPTQNTVGKPVTLYSLDVAGADLAEVVELNPGQSSGASGGAWLHQLDDMILSLEGGGGQFEQRLRLYSNGAWSTLYEGVTLYGQIAYTASDGFYVPSAAFTNQGYVWTLSYIDESGISDLVTLPAEVRPFSISTVGNSVIYATSVTSSGNPSYSAYEARVWHLDSTGTNTEVFDLSGYVADATDYAVNLEFLNYGFSAESTSSRFAGVGRMSRSSNATPTDINLVIDQAGNVFQRSVLNGASIEVLGPVFEFAGGLYGGFHDQSSGDNFLAEIVLDANASPPTFSYQVVTPSDASELPILKKLAEDDGGMIMASAEYAWTPATQFGLWRLDDSGLRKIPGTERQLIVNLTNSSVMTDQGLVYAAFSLEPGIDLSLINGNYTQATSRLFLLDGSGSVYLEAFPGGFGFSSLAKLGDRLFVSNYSPRTGPVIASLNLLPTPSSSAGFVTVPIVSGGSLTWVDGTLRWRFELRNATLSGATLDEASLVVSGDAAGYEVVLPSSIKSGTFVDLETSLGGLRVNVPDVPIRPSSDTVKASIKRVGDKARVAVSSLVGVGKVQILVNGKEIAWVRAVDASDPKLRKSNDVSYLVRSTSLVAGKNRIEILVNGQRQRLVTYSN